MAIPDELINAARKAASEAYDKAFQTNLNNPSLSPKNAVDGVAAAADAALAAAFAKLPECEVEIYELKTWQVGLVLQELARMAES